MPLQYLKERLNAKVKQNGTKNRFSTSAERDL